MLLRPMKNGDGDEQKKVKGKQKGNKMSKNNPEKDSETLNGDALDLVELSVSFQFSVLFSSKKLLLKLNSKSIAGLEWIGCA